MKSLNLIFSLLLFPFLFLLRYSLTLKEKVYFKQKNSKHAKNEKLHHQFITFIISILFFTLLVTSPVSAVTPGIDCSSLDSDNTVEGNDTTTSGTLNAADPQGNTNHYYQYITGGPGEVIIRFQSTESIKFYASTDCPMTDYFVEVDPARTEGNGLITLDTNTTIYINAERTNRNADYNFTIEFTEAPTELDLPPTLCYDYSYEQKGIYFTENNDGSLEPSIIGTELDPTEPITVEFYIQNTDAADNDMENMVVNIFDINTTQAAYELGTTYIIEPGELTTTHYTDINATASYNNDIIIGDVESRNFFYVYYDLDPTSTVIDIPLNIRLDYDVSYDYGTSSSVDIHYETVINSAISLCNRNNFSYTPAYGIFNMEDSVLSYADDDKGYYNLPTQTVNRVGAFVVAAYDASNVYSRIQVNTPVAIELIDAGKHDDTATSCREPDSVVGSRIWVIFDDDAKRTDFNYDTINTAVNDPVLDNILPLLRAEEFYNIALENAAFKLSYNGAGNGELIELDKVTCGPNNHDDEWCYNVLNFTEIIKYNGGNCIQDVDGREGNIDKIPQFCNNAGLDNASAMTPAELAVCMECIYGFDVNYLCSRDNFAIRPESYRMTLNDQKQTDTTQQSTIAINDDEGTNQDRNHTTDNGPYHVAAGYNYALQIRATNHENDNATLGYDAGFFIDGNDSQRFFSLAWQPFTDDGTYCNDTEDHNKTLSLINGGADLNLSSTQVGKYNLTIFDKLWTRVDWDPTVMTHHTTGQGAGYFLAGTDCVENTSYVPQSSTLTSIDNNNIIENVSGCDISSNNHTNIDADPDLKYKDIALRVHPYKFDLNGSNPIDPMIGPYTRTNDQTFVYINTPPTLDANNTNMSYNMNGTFFAAGYYDIGSLSNFVTGCYADDVNMDLNFTYNSPEPALDKEPFLSYSLKDHNTTDSTDIFRPDQTTPTDDFEVGTHDSSITAFIIAQGEEFFDKDMKGAITMDLGYNFVRDYNKTLNPRYIEFHDFNITYIDDGSKPSLVKADLESDFQIFGDRILDHNVTFVYGRAKPSQEFYDGVTASFIDTPVSVVVYCDQDPITCSAVYNIDTALGKTDEYNWYLLRDSATKVDPTNDHVTTENDGNITLDVNATTPGASVAPSDPTAVAINNSGGVNNPDVRVTATVADRPLDVYIDFGANTNRWLIYNKSQNTIPTHFYRVEFIGQMDWAGHGDTGHVVDSNISTKKNRRLSW